MNLIKRGIKGIRNDPMYTIGVILAVSLFVFSIYFMGPWYVGGPTTAIGSSFDNQVARATLGVVYLIPCVATVVGTVQKKWRRFGAFGMAACFTFVTLLRLLTFGFAPLIWLFIFACGLISGIVYLYESLNRDTI